MRKERIVIVDGYNVIHLVPDLKRHLGRSLESAREALLRYCARWRLKRRDVSRIYVVFDGDSSVAGLRREPAPGVREIFTGTREEADDRIMDIVKRRHSAAECVVVSDDGYVARTSRRFTAKVMSVSDFYRRPGRGKRTGARGAEGGTASSLTPREEKEINEALKKEWGIE